MSQVSIIDIESANPQVPTRFNANLNFAIPVMNILEIFGDVVDPLGIPIRTVGNGNNITTNVQVSSAILASDRSQVGLAAFDSSQFDVDADGFVSISSTGLGVMSVSGTPNRITSTGGANPVIDIDLNYVGQTSIITVGTISTGTWESSIVEVPYGGTGANSFTNYGVLYGQTTNPITATAAGTNGQVLIAATGSAPAFATLSSSDLSISFSPGANSLSLIVAGGSTVGKTITGDNASAVSPSGGNWNIFGTANQITTTGATPTLTLSTPSTFIAPGSIASTTTITAATGLTVTTGNAAISAGNITLPNTNAGLTQGVLTWSSGPRIHNFGTANIFFGATAGNGTLSGVANIAIGTNGLSVLTSGSANVSVGYEANKTISTGSDNVSVGYSALKNASTSLSNISIGTNSHFSLLTGLGRNVAVGYQSNSQLSTGTDCTSIGYQAGSAYNAAETNNICIGSGVLGTAAETGVTRIGANQTKCYIDGITGVTVAASAPIAINSSDQISSLGFGTSTQVLTSNGAGNSPTWQSVPGSTMTWTDQSGAFAATADNGYFITSTSTATLPVSPSQGDLIIFSLDTTNILTIQANTGQFIRIGSSITSGAAGTALSTARGDSISLVYRSSDVTWIASSVIGSWTLS